MLAIAMAAVMAVGLALADARGLLSPAGQRTDASDGNGMALLVGVIGTLATLGLAWTAIRPAARKMDDAEAAAVDTASFDDTVARRLAELGGAAPEPPAGRSAPDRVRTFGRRSA